MSCKVVSARRAAYGCLALLALFMSWPSAASAHGAAPEAMQLLGWENGAATLVRTTRGLAHRSGDGFRFMCPEATGGDVTAPTGAIPGGPAVVASDRLFLVYADGRTALHPTHRGAGLVLAHNHAALFGLFTNRDKTELRRITELDSELIASFDEPFSALAVSDTALFIARFVDADVELQELSIAGEPSARMAWRASSAVYSLELRCVGEETYILTYGSAKPWVTLATLAASGPRTLHEANVSIVGPVAVADETLVAIDGALQTLDGSRLVSNDVTCLDAFRDQPYGCSAGELRALDERGLAEPSFALRSLREPDDSSLTGFDRELCAQRWLDLQEHIAELAAADAGATVSDSADAAVELETTNGTPRGCSVGPKRPSTTWCWLLMASLVLGAWRSSRRSRRASPSAKVAHDAAHAF